MSLAHRLEKTYTGAVHDVLLAMGHRDCVLPPEIRPLDPYRRLAGEVFTVSGHSDESLDDHETLLQWTGMLSRVPANTVAVCQPTTTPCATWRTLRGNAEAARRARLHRRRRLPRH